MQQLSCNVIKCPYNAQHPSGNGLTCTLDVMSIYNGLCEFWEAYRESKRLDEIDTIRSKK